MYLKFTSLSLDFPKFYFCEISLLCKISKLMTFSTGVFFVLSFLVVFQWIMLNVNAKEPFSPNNSWNNLKVLHIIKLGIYKCSLLDSLQGNLLLIIKPWTTISAECGVFNRTGSCEQILLWHHGIICILLLMIYSL